MMCTSLLFYSGKTFQEKVKQLYWNLIVKPNKTLKDIKHLLIYLIFVDKIFQLTHKDITEDKDSSQGLDAFISKNLIKLLDEFEKFSEEYKNCISKYTKIEEFKKHLCL